jgi:GTPase KRas protein
MPEVRIVVFGSGSVGKSALTLQFISNKFLEFYDPTIEDSYRKQINIDGTPFVLEILDTAGQEEYTSLRDSYLRSGQGFLLVYAINNRSSFQEAQRLHEQILKVRETSSFPMVLVGNKCDLEHERQVSKQEAEDLAKSWGIPMLETSAKIRKNVDEAFQALVRLIHPTKAVVSGTKIKRRKCPFL